jgi:hypothetical protein
MSRSILAASLALLVTGGTAFGGLVLEPLSTFGSGGWLAPGTRPYLTSDNTQRGMTYNPLTNHVYVMNRAGGVSVNIVDGTTGANVGALDVTGITGGTFAANMIGVGADGAIYVGNLSTSNTSNFKIYRWANEAAAPTVAYDGLTTLTRTGDSFAVIGSGSNTRIVASGSGHPSVALFDTADGSNFTVTSASPITGAPAIPNGAFRLGLAFMDSNNVIGKQTSTPLYTGNLGSSTGATYAVNSAGEAPLAYYGPEQLLATVDINSNDVRLYDASDLSLLTSTGFLDLKNATTAFAPNANGTGDLSFGVGPDGALRLYVLNSNNGIQAFTVVPEPASLGLVGLAGAALLARRRR